MWGSRSDVNLHHPQTTMAGDTSSPGTTKYFLYVQTYKKMKTSNHFLRIEEADFQKNLEKNPESVSDILSKVYLLKWQMLVIFHFSMLAGMKIHRPNNFVWYFICDLEMFDIQENVPNFTDTSHEVSLLTKLMKSYGLLFRPGTMQVFMFPGRVYKSQAGTCVTLREI